MSQTSAATSDVYFCDASAENSWSARTYLFMAEPHESPPKKKQSKWLEKLIKRRGLE